VGAAYQKLSEHLVTLFGDTPLRVPIPRLIPGRHQPQIGAHAAALLEAVGILQRQHEGKRRKRPDSLDLAQELGFRVVLFADLLQLALVVADTLRQRADLLQDGPKGRSTSGMCAAAFLWKLLAGHLGNLL
jgi:hypothetical protein